MTIQLERPLASQMLIAARDQLRAAKGVTEGTHALRPTREVLEDLYAAKAAYLQQIQEIDAKIAELEAA